jgi:hypothetical protein
MILDLFIALLMASLNCFYFRVKFKELLALINEIEELFIPITKKDLLKM